VVLHHIQTIKFKFKRTNQELTAHYRPPAPVTGGSAGGTTQFGRTLPLPPVETSTSPPTGGTAQRAGATASGAGGSATHWNQPQETALHMLARCRYSKAVWQGLQGWLSINLQRPPCDSYRKLQGWWNSMIRLHEPGADARA
jgi:hypothetical protein